MTDRYAVMGHPIAHSRSPRIHALFAAQTGQDMSYEAVDVEPGHFPEAVAEFRGAGGRGLNVTVPYKQQAWTLSERRSERAQRAGAVNTLVLDPAELFGDNTDGAGLVRDLTGNHGLALDGRRVLLVGAGGAARGVLEPLLAQGPRRLVIANRTPGRAVELAGAFRGLGPVEGCGFADLQDRRFDLIINATAAGLAGEVPPLPGHVAAEGAWCYDMMYGAGPTAFVAWAREHGVAHAVDGLGMLVEQAAESFRLWRGVEPDTAPVIETLRSELRREA